MADKIISETPSPTGLGAILKTMRIPHWIKNAFVVAPILFSGQFIYPWAWVRCLAAFASFCLLSSAVYLINDIADRKADAAHPSKCSRPIASGRLSPITAAIAAIFLIAAGLGLAGWVTWANYGCDVMFQRVGVLVWAAAYLVLNLLYSLRLKSVVILDVIIVALGFVIRAVAGAAAITVPISPWLVVCTFTICLFIALGKRRSEIQDLSPDESNQTRKALRAYDLPFIEHMLGVSASMAILTYSIYTLAPQTIERVGSAHMIWTIPLVVYGMFRYYLITSRCGKGDPVVVLLRDRRMWIVMLAFAVLSALIVKYGSHPSVSSLLDVPR
ncbi:MAG: decaprenyl-phosphate phosphoribosyltransferase [Phycisphaerae bacterium]|nr:decaprenyl-phosphate phosphoribosyltransferase [Phycisphaerae bacterium]